MKDNVRPKHRKLALWIALPLIISASTGLIFRLGRAWFGMKKPTGEIILQIHTGMWMGKWLSTLYLVAAASGLLFMIYTGLRMLALSRSQNRVRKTHRWLGVMLLLPLAATALTGMIYHVGVAWFDISKNTEDILMSIHEGGWLGKAIKPFYVLIIGGGMLGLIFSGLRLRLPPRKANPKSPD